MVEANPSLAAKLGHLGFGTVISAALASSDGETLFYHRDNLEAGGIYRSMSNHQTETPVETVSLETLRRRHDVTSVDLLKLDIEGAEFDFLKFTPDDILRKVTQISVEFHDFLPDFEDKTLVPLARKRLASLGFSCYPMSFRTNGDVLFVNRKLAKMSLFQHLAILLVGKWYLKIRNSQGI